MTFKQGMCIWLLYFISQMTRKFLEKVTHKITRSLKQHQPINSTYFIRRDRLSTAKNMQLRFKGSCLT